MLATQYTSIPVHAEVIYKNNLIGRKVYVDTLLFGQQSGSIVRVVPCPFYGQSGLMAYIVGNGWTEYVFLDRLVFVETSCTCCDCGKEYAESMVCPECGFCLNCCDCVTENADDLIEIEDYQPPRFLWQGRWFPE